jgi:hypothetical protein
MVSLLIRPDALQEMERDGNLRAVLNDLGFNMSSLAPEKIEQEKVYTDAPGFYTGEGRMSDIFDKRATPKGEGVLLTQGEYGDY